MKTFVCKKIKYTLQCNYFSYFKQLCAANTDQVAALLDFALDFISLDFALDALQYQCSFLHLTVVMCDMVLSLSQNLLGFCMLSDYNSN